MTEFERSIEDRVKEMIAKVNKGESPSPDDSILKFIGEHFKEIMKHVSKETLIRIDLGLMDDHSEACNWLMKKFAEGDLDSVREAYATMNGKENKALRHLFSTMDEQDLLKNWAHLYLKAKSGKYDMNLPESIIFPKGIDDEKRRFEERKNDIVDGTIKAKLGFRTFPDYTGSEELLYIDSSGSDFLICKKKIRFDRQYEGSAIRNVSFSPDYKRIAFDCIVEGLGSSFNVAEWTKTDLYRRVFIVNTDGTNYLQLTSENRDRVTELFEMDDWIGESGLRIKNPEQGIMSGREYVSTHISNYCPIWVNDSSVQFKRSVSVSGEYGSLNLEKVTKFVVRIDKNNNVLGKIQNVGTEFVGEQE
jgi:hypothetical protein